MGAKYIYRLDDITPYMNWEKFFKYINLFKKYNVKPLIGIVPDNKDNKLIVDKENKEFWSIINDLYSKGIIDIAQHGYQHKLHKAQNGSYFGIKHNKCLTEFTGLPYNKQLKMIRSGQFILRENGIYTDIWMAPCHSFDDITIRVLKDLGFKKITDGIGVYPFLKEGLVFVPQQLWKPKWFPFGVFTICIHINSSSDEMFYKIEKHLKSGVKIISFNHAILRLGILYSLLNFLFKVAYMTIYRVKRLV